MKGNKISGEKNEREGVTGREMEREEKSGEREEKSGGGGGYEDKINSRNERAHMNGT